MLFYVFEGDHPQPFNSKKFEEVDSSNFQFDLALIKLPL